MHSLPHLYSIQPTYRPSNSSCWCWNTTFHLMFNVLPQSHHVAIYTRRVLASVLGTWANGVPEMEAAFKPWYAMVNPHHASHGICCRSVLLLPLNRFNSLFNLIWLFAVNFFIFYDWNDKTSSLNRNENSKHNSSTLLGHSLLRHCLDFSSHAAHKEMSWTKSDRGRAKA